MITITNKEGKPINVVTFAEEAKRIAVPKAKPEEVEEAVEAVEKEIPEKVVEAPQVDWGWIRGIVSRIESWLGSMEHQAEVRNALALYAYLRSINEWLSEAKGRLLAGSEFLRIHEARKVEPVYKILTDAEYEDLWRLWSETLRKAGLDPAKYRDRFEELIAWNMPYSDNELVLMDEARTIILEKKFEKYLRRLLAEPQPPVRFSWKYVQWAIGSLRVDVGVLKDSVREENALQCYTTIERILDTAEKLKRMLESVPEVKAFRFEHE